MVAEGSKGWTNRRRSSPFDPAQSVLSSIRRASSSSVQSDSPTSLTQRKLTRPAPSERALMQLSRRPSFLSSTSAGATLHVECSPAVA